MSTGEENATHAGRAPEPGAGEAAAARALLAAIESRVFSGSLPMPLFAQATAIRNVVTRLFGHAG